MSSSIHTRKLILWMFLSVFLFLGVVGTSYLLGYREGMAQAYKEIGTIQIDRAK